mmetsp:Transcript_26036/g.62972  ORF Transcript_26036/g.62972 Transcript_26036/m.62972 type:complete len:252 (+) Transcript_26036:1962-2717(+)
MCRTLSLRSKQMQLLVHAFLSNSRLRMVTHLLCCCSLHLAQRQSRSLRISSRLRCFQMTNGSERPRSFRSKSPMLHHSMNFRSSLTVIGSILKAKIRRLERSPPSISTRTHVIRWDGLGLCMQQFLTTRTVPRSCSAWVHYRLIATASRFQLFYGLTGWKHLRFARCCGRCKAQKLMFSMETTKKDLIGFVKRWRHSKATLRCSPCYGRQVFARGAMQMLALYRNWRSKRTAFSKLDLAFTTLSTRMMFQK